MAGPLGKQLLSFRLITKKRAYLALGAVLLPWYLYRSFAELSSGNLGMYDAYAVVGVVFAIIMLVVGWRMPSQD